MKKKHCKQCDRLLSVDQFWKSGKKLQWCCKTCQSKYQREWDRQNRDKCREMRQRWLATNREKARAACRAWYAKNKHKVRAREYINGYRRSLWKKAYYHGITPEQYQLLLDQSGGKCAICGKENKEHRTLNVDHCHKTGEIRGLLCGPCNKALGAFGDDLAGVMRVVKYLKGKWSGIMVTKTKPKRAWIVKRKTLPVSGALAPVPQPEVCNGR